MPPHLGHQFLIDFARHVTRNLTIVVGTLADEPICGRLRYEWVQQLYPRLRVVHLTDQNPQYPEDHPHFWKIWKDSLERVAPTPIELLFASESYGAKLAETLGAKFVPTNSGRSLIPISATAIRAYPWRHWKQIPRAVRSFYAQQVVVTGGGQEQRESLCKALSSFFEGLFIPEYPVNTGLGQPESGLCQRASEEAGRAQGLPLLVIERARFAPHSESTRVDLVLELECDKSPTPGVHRLQGSSEQQLEEARRLIIEGFRGGTKGVFTDFTR